jgi:GDP-mannose 6-dehydrogenase
MRISVFGLGYVGCVSVGCLAKNGHHITGVDLNEYKVELINKGLPTIVEKDLDVLIKQGWSEGLVSATTDYQKAVEQSEISFICVGTPNLPTGQLNLEFVFETARQIAESLRSKQVFFVVAIRSTVLPGTNERVGEIVEQVSGKMRNVDFAVVSNPEFLREGVAVEDYYNPSVTVLGSESERALEIMSEIYASVNSPIVKTDIRVAELIKYVNNTFHALKISFANEIGNICKAIDVDAFKVMDLFKRDTRLNISLVYFNPGMPYGGACLPKDLKGLSTLSHDYYLNTPVINAIESSNEQQKQIVLDYILKLNVRKLALFGLAFKKGTDDLRFSPGVQLAESLIGKGYSIKVYDKNVNVSLLTGANKSYIEQHMPHLSSLLVSSLPEFCRNTDTIILAHKPDSEEMEILKNFRGKIFDLVHISSNDFPYATIIGLSW